VQGTHRFRERRQLEFAAHGLRQSIRKIRLLERARRQLAQGFLAKPGRGRINRGKGLRQRRRFAAQHLEARMDHFRAEESLADFSHHANAGAFGERFSLAFIEIEVAQRDQAAAVVHLRDQLPPRTEFHFRLHHCAFDLHGVTGQCFVDGGDARFVFVTQR